MDHSKLVAALAKPGADIIADLTPLSAHLLHMAVGVVGEVIEVIEGMNNADRANIIEELGDIEFYMRGIYDTTGIERVGAIECFFSTGELVRLAGQLLDNVKKTVIYNKPPANLDKLAGVLACIEDQLHGIRTSYNLSREQVIAHNFAKLTKRYGEKYSNAAAIARADKS